MPICAVSCKTSSGFPCPCRSDETSGYVCVGTALHGVRRSFPNTEEKALAPREMPHKRPMVLPLQGDYKV